MKNVFLDSDAVLDLLLKREPHHLSIAFVFEQAKLNKIRLHTSSICIVNVHYILKKTYTLDQIKVILNKFFLYVNILSVNSDIIRLALNSFFRDFEDGVQYYTSLKNNINTILTRNIRDYKVDDISIMTPDEFLKIL